MLRRRLPLAIFFHHHDATDAKVFATAFGIPGSRHGLSFPKPRGGPDCRRHGSSRALRLSAEGLVVAVINPHGPQENPMSMLLMPPLAWDTFATGVAHQHPASTPRTMKKRSLTFTLLAGAFSVCMAQSDPPDVFSTAGGDGSSSTERMSWTIGEPVTNTVSAGSNTMTQGFQQPWAEVITLVPELTEQTDGISVYPNPTRHVLHVRYPDGSSTGDRIELTDGRGQLLLQDHVQGATTDLDLSSYASGNYFLRLIGPQGTMKRTFHIIIAQ